jgi:hypothetical protein
MSSTTFRDHALSDSDRSLPPILLVLILLGSAVILYCVARELRSTFLHRDPSSYLYEAGRMLAGDTLYGPRLDETNPPLIIWISAVPDVLSSLLHIPVILTLKLCIFASLALVSFWCYSLLRRAGSHLSVAQRLLMSLAIPLAILLTQPDTFAQREQLLVLLLLPYLVAGSADVVSTSLLERILLGVLAGLAICLKPFHLLTLTGIELLLILSRRSLRSLVRTELIALILTGAAFLATVRLFVPQYFTDVLPTLDLAYWGLAEHSVKIMLLFVAAPMELLILCAWIAWALLRRKLNLPLVSAALLAAATGATLAFALQRTAWPYHRYPASVLLYLGLAWLAIDALTALARPLLHQGWRSPALWAVTCAAVLVTLGVAIKYQRYIRRHEAPLSVGLLFAGYPPGTTVYELSPGIGPYNEVLLHHLHWAGRSVCLWMLPAIVRNEAGPRDPNLPFKKLPPETVASLAARQRRAVKEDLATQRPQVVAVSQCVGENHCQGLDRDLDIVQWFSADPQFVAEWAHYQRQGTIRDFDVYVRNPAQQ